MQSSQGIDWLPACLPAWLPGCLPAWLPACLAGWLADPTHLEAVVRLVEGSVEPRVVQQAVHPVEARVLNHLPMRVRVRVCVCCTKTGDK